MSRRYLKLEKETNAAIDEEGWLHSGDQAKIDADGFVRVTGRLKELIVTAGGENVSPVPIENKVIELCPLISNCVVVGDQRKFLSALIALKTEVDPATGEPSNRIAASMVESLKSRGSQATTVEEAMQCPVVKKWIQDAIDGYNKVAISRAQEIRKWTLLHEDLSLGKGELTATLKMKRNVVHQHYEKEIQAMYEEWSVCGKQESKHKDYRLE